MPLTVKPSCRRATCPTSVGNCGKSRVEKWQIPVIGKCYLQRKEELF
jgi:hypothetical protein